MKHISLTLTAILLSFISFAQTSVPGGNVSGTWTLAGSPYLVQGSVMIPDGATLTIEPGVRVQFQGTYKLLVLGRLLAVGTAADTITFTADDTISGWRSIRFDETPATNDSSLIVYCKLEYGKATGVPYDDYGGGIYFNNFPKARISNCLITHCYADEAGGGICCRNSSPVIANNTITQNIGANVGGGICCHAGSNPTIIHNTITHNTTFFNGGGGISAVSCHPLIRDNIIAYNSNSIYSGGGIWCNGCTAEISGNFIANNSAPFGGGISISGATPTLVNNTITNNTADEGGGIHCLSSFPVITNTTISNNIATKGGGVLCAITSSPVLRNAILWGNFSSSGGEQVNLVDEGSDPDFFFCDVQGGSGAFQMNFNVYTGVYQNNIDSDPEYVWPSAGTGIYYDGLAVDWSLQDGSPCINAGDPAGAYPPTDIVGNPRVVEGTIDIGAFEYQWPVAIHSVNCPGELLLYPNPVQDHLVVEYPQKARLEISAVNGQIIQTIDHPGGKTKIDAGNLPGGVYVVRVITADAVRMGRVVKR